MENEGAEKVKSERVENGRISRETNRFPFSKKIKREFEGISSDPSSSFLLFTV